jgi:AAA15 family ATPase/GTPase
MLIRVSVQNFLSFAERTSFSMIPGKGRILPHHIVPGKKARDIPVLKTAMIYGANASGKSNLVRAINFGRRFILHGTKKEAERINFTPFRLDDALHIPTRLEFEIKCKDANYAYGFECNNKEILEEWLYLINKETELLVYERRKEENKYKFNPSGIRFDNDEERQFLEFTNAGTRSNQLFITECNVRNVASNVSGMKAVFDVFDWFENALKVIMPSTKYETGLAFEWGDNDNLKSAFHDFLSYFNTGVKGIDFEELPVNKVPDLPNELLDKIREEMNSESVRIILNSPEGVNYALSKNGKGDLLANKMITLHKQRNNKKIERFELKSESDGTQRIMDLIPIMMDLFKGDNVFIIDELDRSLHPNLTYDFIDLFLEKTKGIPSQLIVTTHESRLLSQKLVRKDEIWFAWKDDKETSSMYSLEEFNIRFDKEIRNDYLLGRFKGVPKFGNRNRITVLKSSNNGQGKAAV